MYPSALNKKKIYQSENAKWLIKPRHDSSTTDLWFHNGNFQYESEWQSSVQFKITFP